MLFRSLARRRRRIVIYQAERQANNRIRRACRQLDSLLEGLWPGEISLAGSQPLAQQPNPETQLLAGEMDPPPLHNAASLPAGNHPERDLDRVTDRLQLFLYSARNLALLDPLTQLPNRRYFLNQVSQTAARKSLLGQQFGLLFVDVDKFKVINDSYGHAVGDAVLVHVCQRLRAILEMDDFIARWGGDELAVILDLSNVEDQSRESLARAARERAQRMVDSLIAPLHVGDLPIAVSLSIGITLVDPRDADLTAVIQRADVAMYQAKQIGRAHV